MECPTYTSQEERPRLQQPGFDTLQVQGKNGQAHDDQYDTKQYQSSHGPILLWFVLMPVIFL
jgi:hypothetical protein